MHLALLKSFMHFLLVQVLQALGSMEFPNIYPDPANRKLRAALAAYTGVPAEHLLVCHSYFNPERFLVSTLVT